VNSRKFSETESNVLRIQHRQLVIDRNSDFDTAGAAPRIEEHIIALEAWHIRCREQTYIPGALPQTRDCGTIAAGASRHPWPEVDKITVHTAPGKTALGTSRK
jgi:hypothetical protein